MLEVVWLELLSRKWWRYTIFCSFGAFIIYNLVLRNILKMDNGSNKKIINEICDYSQSIDAKDLLHEYMKR